MLSINGNNLSLNYHLILCIIHDQVTQFGVCLFLRDFLLPINLHHEDHYNDDGDDNEIDINKINNSDNTNAQNHDEIFVHKMSMISNVIHELDLIFVCILNQDQLHMIQFQTS